MIAPTRGMVLGRAVILLIIYTNLPVPVAAAGDDDDNGVLYPTKCEACKYLAVELQDRLKETGHTHDVIETGYALDGIRTKKKYKDSELRLVESLEGICDRILQYNIHKERKDSTRFAKGMSETFRTLHGLVDKGVKVELGIPHELWDKPSVEVTTLKSECETLLEQHEDDIEDWYYNHQKTPLQRFLCAERVLRKGDHGCLVEDLPAIDSTSNDKQQTRPRQKKTEL